MRYSILQMDLVAGDLKANANRIISKVLEEAAKGSQLCISPELALIGYIPADYLRYPAFLKYADQLLAEIAGKISACGCALLLGTVGQDERGRLYNRACYIANGRIQAYCDKKNLTDCEKPYFSPGQGHIAIQLQDKKICVCIADAYGDCLSGKSGKYDILVNICADVFASETFGEKQRIFRKLAKDNAMQIMYANAAGACDNKIFAGASIVANSSGEYRMVALFEPESLAFEENAKCEPAVCQPPEERIFSALVFGVREYCKKTKIGKIALGLSGGVDSALVAAIACTAIGPENVIGALMPSPWSSCHSLTDARDLAKNLGMPTWELPIGQVMSEYQTVLGKPFAGLEEDVTEENIQARIRGNLIMALANKFGAMAVTTGNKSEILVGYCTMYGDTCGALAVIGDLYKTEVYRLCHWLNSRREIIPDNILKKAPSAELRPGQTDQDSLPPYEILDAILRALVDERLDEKEVVKLGHDPEVVKKVASLVARAQFKRAQLAPALLVHKPVYLHMPICGKFPFDY